MSLHSKKQANILALGAKERCDYFVRKVADFERVWGLFEIGWASFRAGDATVLPFWPEEEFACLCAHSEWEGYTPREIKISDFMSTWLPGMVIDNRMCLAFPNPENQGFLIGPEDLKSLIESEIKQYE